MIPDNQLARGIQAKKTRGPVGGVGGQASYEPVGLGGLNFLSSSKNILSDSFQVQRISTFEARYSFFGGIEN